MQIEKYLAAINAVGSKMAVKRRLAAEALGISERELRAQCEDARMKGVFIGWSNMGIFLASNDAERQEILHRLARECAPRMRQRRALREVMRCREQLRLPFMMS